VKEASYQILISYGKIAHTKNLDLQTNRRDYLSMKRKLLQLKITKEVPSGGTIKKLNSIRVPYKKRNVSKIICYNCQNLGHFSYDCPQGKGKRNHQEHVAKKRNILSQRKL
jgi:hypothetical protein